MQHREMKVRQRIIVVAIEYQMLAVLEAATGEDDRQIRRQMRVGVVEVRAEEHLCTIKERLATFLRFFQAIQEGIEILEMLHVDCLQLSELVRLLSMVREAVVLLSDREP